MENGLCEILTLRAQRGKPDPGENRKLWHKGYIIQVNPDGYPWGRKERKSVWLASGGSEADWHDQTQLFLLPGTLASEFMRTDVRFSDLILPQETDDAGNPVFETETGEMTLVDEGFGAFRFRRRMWQVREDLPSPIENALNADGEVIISPVGQFNAIVNLTKDGEGG